MLCGHIGKSAHCPETNGRPAIGSAAHRHKTDGRVFFVPKVQIGVGFVMPLNKWHYILKCTSEAKCALGLAQHLWTPTQAGERSQTGQACRTISGASGKLLARPEKVAAVKNCLEKYIWEHPMGPPAPPSEHRLASVRKHLWSFTEAGARASECGRRESP
ncbi:uncharacterized protein LOC119463647 [Dermacentor silvarum]|uniref:uncharacterized protein LOC119463647 n=1 Tax=Dermacentor silvarum TaxID=543639 RepID=UPI00189A38C9|nr:uncharacterized protein LOC119463647 [Dermacentor silvarum]